MKVLLKSFEFLKGLTVAEAMEEMKNIERFKLLYIRVTRKNGVPMIVTMDYRTDRLNVWTVDDKITHIVGFG